MVSYPMFKRELYDRTDRVFRESETGVTCVTAVTGVTCVIIVTCVTRDMGDCDLKKCFIC